eukprot:gene16478-biopygen2249
MAVLKYLVKTDRGGKTEAGRATRARVAASPTAGSPFIYGCSLHTCRWRKNPWTVGLRTRPSLVLAAGFAGPEKASVLRTAGVILRNPRGSPLPRLAGEGFMGEHGCRAGAGETLERTMARRPHGVADRSISPERNGCARVRCASVSLNSIVRPSGPRPVRVRCRFPQGAAASQREAVAAARAAKYRNLYRTFGGSRPQAPSRQGTVGKTEELEQCCAAGAAKGGNGGGGSNCGAAAAASEKIRNLHIQGRWLQKDVQPQ